MLFLNFCPKIEFRCHNKYPDIKFIQFFSTFFCVNLVNIQALFSIPLSALTLPIFYRKFLNMNPPQLFSIFLLFCAFGCSRTTLESVEARYDRQPTRIIVDTLQNGPPETVNVQTEPILENVKRTVITLKTTPCYGKCPVFELKFSENQYVTRRGYAHTDNIGSYEARITGKVMEEIVQRAEAAGLYEMQNMYPTRGEFLEDYPSTVVSITDGEREKRIVHIYDAPAALKNFEEYLLSVTKQLRWEEITEFAD